MLAKNILRYSRRCLRHFTCTIKIISQKIDESKTNSYKYYIFAKQIHAKLFYSQREFTNLSQTTNDLIKIVIEFKLMTGYRKLSIIFSIAVSYLHLRNKIYVIIYYSVGKASVSVGEESDLVG